nr:unnamed protein product [Spirometra erinaceieuropaei]
MALRCCDWYLRSKRHEDLDESSTVAFTQTEWNQFTQFFYETAKEPSPFEEGEPIYQRCQFLCDKINAVNPQFELDGCRNIWIVKPGAKSRGRGTTIMETIQFTESMVLRLKESKSPGPDEIPAKILKELAAVHFGEQQSTEVAVRSGVPQGSVLGPTLFLIYINDRVNELDCDIAMFADDINIWSTIRSEADEARLQTNLDHLEQWSKDWLLPFNVNKCNFLRVGGTSSPNRMVYRLTSKPLQEFDD